MPLATRDSISLEDILTGVTMDKKKRGNILTLVLVPKIGTSLLKKWNWANWPIILEVKHDNITDYPQSLTGTLRIPSSKAWAIRP